MKGRIKKVGQLKASERAGAITGIEIYEVAYDLRDEPTKNALAENRHRAVRGFLEANGHVVRELHITTAEGGETEPEPEVTICDYAHVTSPESRASEYIEFNCRPGVVETL
jgi:hypothetical protein